jgi:hypothetical protein
MAEPMTLRSFVYQAVMLYAVMVVLVFIFGVFAWLFTHGSNFVEVVVRGALLWPAHFLNIR